MKIHLEPKELNTNHFLQQYKKQEKALFLNGELQHKLSTNGYQDVTFMLKMTSITFY